MPPYILTLSCLAGMKTISHPCELCTRQASLYCFSDSAFLCWSCDELVHGANFLVARHVRSLICSHCCNSTGSPLFSGTHPQLLPYICCSCNIKDNQDTLSSSSCSSVCISSTKSSALKRLSTVASLNSAEQVSNKRPRFSASNREIMDCKGGAVLADWSGHSGSKGSFVAEIAFHAFSSCLTVLAYRVALAASMWYSLRLCQEKSAPNWHELKKLEEISAVPAKLIVAAESKPQRQHEEEEEGWDES